MCGRTSFCLSPEEVEALYTRVAAAGDAARQRQRRGRGGEGNEQQQQQQQQQLALPDHDRGRFRRSPNVAPTSSLPVLSRSSSSADADASSCFSIEVMRWGIFTGSPTLPFIINARSETAASLASFSRLLSSPSGRGVVAADGYYEWETKIKQPYFIHRSDGAPMLLAALVERRARGRGGGKGVDDEDADDGAHRQPRFVVLTRSPPKALRWLHDRCPCIFPSEELAKEWLTVVGSSSGTAAAQEASELLSRAGAAVEASFGGARGETEQQEKKRSPPLLSWHPVTREVGKTSYQRSDASKDVRLGGIASLFGKARSSAKKKKEEGEDALAAARKDVEETEKKEHPFAFHSGVKRNHEGGTIAPPLEQRQQPPVKKATTAAAAAAKTMTTTTTPGKGQRSLDAFLTPKKE